MIFKSESHGEQNKISRELYNVLVIIMFKLWVKKSAWFKSTIGNLISEDTSQQFQYLT